LQCEQQEAFYKSVHGAEMMIGLVLMLFVKLFFVESLILTAVVVANSSSMHTVAQAAKAWGHLSIDIWARILTPFSL